MGFEGIFGFGKKKEMPSSKEDQANKEAIAQRLEEIAEHHEDPYQPEIMPQPEKKEMPEEQQSFHHHADQEKFDRLHYKFSNLEISPQEMRDLEDRDSEFKDYREMKRMGMSPSDKVA